MTSFDSALEFLYDENHVLVVNKKAGLLTQPNQSSEKNLEDLAKGYVKEKKQKEGRVFLHALHRLDKPVSGIVLFAKTSKALSRLSESMRNREVEKMYLAKVEGHLEEKSGELIHFVTHGSHRALVGKEGKKAHLSYAVIQEEGDATLVEIVLHTGRYHQIRAQFSHIGHPILGDTKYGAKFSEGNIALHHAKLTFPHPTTKELKTVTSNPPF